MFDPWYKSTFAYSALGAKLSIQIPHDVFSTQRIDEGTLLLLDHLPAVKPELILDMGCGYGALGLPIAAKYPQAKVEMVDRDLLAVRASAKNAVENKLFNVDAYGSLGFRDVKGARYDWILCNMPARIGTPFIRTFMETGAKLLSAHGEIRVVIINDLTAVLNELKAEHRWPLQEIARGPRHSIFSLPQFTPSAPLAPHDHALYFRDQVKISDLDFDRPSDMGGDDQKRIKSSLPILIDALPRKAFTHTQTILCFRSYYGALALLSRKRWPEAKIVSVERDLLSTTFAKLNADQLNLGGERLEFREAAHFPDAILSRESFDLIIGELSSSTAETVAHSELAAIHQALKKGGQALILCHEKVEKGWVQKFAQAKNIPLLRVLNREGFTVVSLNK